MNTNGPVLDAISNRVIGCALTVAHTLGGGLPEKVYENAGALDRVHRVQCINDPRATGRQLCLLLNFGTPRLEIRRVAPGL